jgi:hypothetical protein
MVSVRFKVCFLRLGCCFDIGSDGSHNSCLAHCMSQTGQCSSWRQCTHAACLGGCQQCLHFIDHCHVFVSHFNT